MIRGWKRQQQLEEHGQGGKEYTSHAGTSVEPITGDVLKRVGWETGRKADGWGPAGLRALPGALLEQGEESYGAMEKTRGDGPVRFALSSMPWHRRLRHSSGSSGS